jgi:hypothetical protein
MKKIKEIALSEACTAFLSSKTGVVGSNPIRGMGICLRSFYVCAILCRYRIYDGPTCRPRISIEFLSTRFRRPANVRPWIAIIFRATQ